MNSMRYTRIAGRYAFVLTCLALSTTSTALELKDSMRIILHGADGTRVDIGSLHTTPAEHGYTYRVELDSARFQDEFLSMRPFRCLAGPQGKLCHLPYPYDIRRHISATDLVDLEYDLLFLRQSPGEYGINAWNGLYYRLAPGPTGLQGTLHEVDLNVLAVPPPAGERRPIRPAQLNATDAADHWLPRLTVE